MKRLLAVLLALTAVFALAACSSAANKAGGETVASEARATEPATEAKTGKVTEAATEPETAPATVPATEPGTSPSEEATIAANTVPATAPETELATEPETEVATEPETEVVTAPATTGAPAAPVTISVLSMNAQNAGSDMSGEASHEAKYGKIAAAIGEKSPDLICLQECVSALPVEEIRSRLPNADDYAAVTGDGAMIALLYNKNVFSLVKQGCFQIGEKDDENGSKYERYMLWAQLRMKETGLPLVAVPIHVDYATKACKAQINIIVDYLKNNFPQIPFVLGGDFNLEIGTVSSTSLSTEGYLDARSSATETVNGNEPTFPGKGTVIDFVWYKSGKVWSAAATRYEVLTQTLPTDHRPIYVELQFER